MSTGDLGLASQLAKWTQKSKKQVVAAVLAELHHHRSDPEDDVCHLVNAVLLLNQLYRFSYEFVYNHLIAQNSLRIVTRVLMHSASRPLTTISEVRNSTSTKFIQGYPLTLKVDMNVEHDYGPPLECFHDLSEPQAARLQHFKALGDARHVRPILNAMSTWTLPAL